MKQQGFSGFTITVLIAVIAAVSVFIAVAKPFQRDTESGFEINLAESQRRSEVSYDETTSNIEPTVESPMPTLPSNPDLTPKPTPTSPSSPDPVEKPTPTPQESTSAVDPCLNIVEPTITYEELYTGATYFPGDNFGTHWDTCNISTETQMRVTLETSTTGSSDSTVLTTGTVNDGYEFFTLPENLPEDTYWVKVAGGGTEAYSQKSITVLDQDAPRITIISPNGGEVFSKDEEIEVVWETEGVPSDAPIRISLMREMDGLVGFSPFANLQLTSTTENDGFQILQFFSSTGSGDNYKIHISTDYLGLGSVRSDTSDTAFTITE